MAEEDEGTETEDQFGNSECAICTEVLLQPFHKLRLRPRLSCPLLGGGAARAMGHRRCPQCRYDEEQVMGAPSLCIVTTQTCVWRFV